MKKVIASILLLLTAICFIGCKDEADDYDVPVSFYYLTDPISFDTDNSVFSQEIREAKSFYGNTSEVLNLYFSGPVHEGYLSPFPAGVSVISLERDQQRIILTLSDSFSTLTGSDLSVACACTGLTVLEYAQCTEVEIKTQATLLDGRSSIIISSQDLYLCDPPVSVD